MAGNLGKDNFSHQTYQTRFSYSFCVVMNGIDGQPKISVWPTTLNVRAIAAVL
jgi:hypothetical protein